MVRLVLLLLAGCGTAKVGVGGGDGDTAGFAADVCLDASDYLASCGLPASQADYDACRAGLEGIEATCDEGSRRSYEAALGALYACLADADYCVGDAMSEAAFLCQRDFADATEPLASCQP